MRKPNLKHLTKTSNPEDIDDELIEADALPTHGVWHDDERDRKAQLRNKDRKRRAAERRQARKTKQQTERNT